MKKVLTLLSCLVMALTLVACGGGDDKKKDGSTGGGGSSSDTLIMGAEKLTGTFSPLYYASSYDGYVVDMVFNKLMDYDVNNELQPELAAEEPTIEDGENGEQIITFKLKEGIKFTNGEEVTANDVAFTFKVLADPSYDGRYGARVDFLKGLETYRGKPAKEGYEGGTGKAEDFTGIVVEDDYTIKFTFTEARSDNLLNVGFYGVMSEKEFEDYEFGDTKVVKDKNKTPVGSGPYVLKKWEASSGAVFQKNKDYTLEEGYAIEKVIIKPVEMSSDWEELKKGSVDLVAGMIEPKKVGPASGTKGIGLSSYPRAGMGYVEMNSVTGPTKDVAVRKALMYAFDRQGFVDSYYECDKCEGIKGVGAYVPSMYQNPASKLGDAVRGEANIEGLDSWTYDIEAAKKLLDEAGWVPGDDGIRVKNGEKLQIKVISMKDHDILSNLIPMWEKDWSEIGVDVKIATVDFNTLLDKVYNDESLDEWNIFFMATSWTTDDMGDIYSSFISTQAVSGGDNLSRVKDTELDSLLNEALAEVDADKAKDIYEKVAVKLGDLCVKVPVYGNTYFDLYNDKKIEDFKTNTLYNWVSALKEAKLK